MAQNLRFRGGVNSVEGDDNKGEEEESLLEEETKFKSVPSGILWKQVPWKAILLAIILTLVGLFMISIYVSSVLGLIAFQPENAITFLILAFITFVPGAYHCVIVFRAIRGDEGYSLDDIADLN